MFRHLTYLSCVPLLILLLVFPGASQNTNPYAEAIKDYEKFVQDKLDHEDLVGFSAAFQFGEHSWSAGFGYGDLENRVPATALSAYRMASVTKPMTAVGILVLAEQGKLDMDAPVQNYVSYFPDKKWPLTIRHLLGHLGGISHYRDYIAESGTVEQMTTGEAIALFAEWDLLHKPGSRYQYTTYGYNLLGAVIEEVSGSTYENFMKENVWLPLGMENTQLDHLYRIIPNRVEGYRKEEGTVVNVRPVNTSLKFAGGGTRSTVIDMVRFARGLSQGKVLPQNVRETMWTSMITDENRFSGYGMGWSVDEYNGRWTVSHGGGQEGTRTFILHYPAHDLTVAIASNYEGTNTFEMASRLVDEILDETTSLPGLYTGKWQDGARSAALRGCFQAGLAYYDRHGKARTIKAKVLAAAFDYVNRFANNDTLTAAEDRGRQLIEDGDQPISGQAFTTAGSFMVRQLVKRNGMQMLDTCRREGPLYFVNAYIDACREGKNIAAANRFSKKFEEQALAWNAAWEKTWTPQLAALTINKDSEPQELKRLFERNFDSEKIYPDFSAELSAVIHENFADGEIKKAQAFADLALQIYPLSDQATADAGILKLLGGKYDAGLDLLQKSRDLNLDGGAGNVRLNTMAYTLAGLEKYDDGLLVLKAARELHPQVANLYDSTGELYLMKGDTTNSINFYEKALEVDPEFENAKMMLERILGKVEE